MRQRLVLTAALVLLASPLMAQAVFDAQSNAPVVLTSVANTATLPHATAVANNRILLAAVHMNLRNATGTTVTSITYGGQPLTLLDAITDGGPDTRTEVWYLLNPPTGTNNLFVTAGGITPGQSVRSVVSATTLSNVDQAAPPSAANEDNNDPATVTVTGTTTTDVVLDFISARETVTLTPDAQVQGYNTSSAAAPGNNDVQASVSGRGGAAGNTNMSWNVSANRNWSIVGVNLRAATADVEVTQRALNDPVVPGGILTYTFQIQNNGPSTASTVTLTDTLPAAVTFVSSNTTQGSCSGTTTVTCNLGTMANGATATVTIQVQAPLTGGPIAANTGTVTTATTDPALPNTASATAYSLVQATVCGTQPGKDGAGGTLAGIVNSYWPGTANAAVGATTITVGARRGAAVSITAGDLILIMQMQDAAIDSSNDDRYGNGNGINGGTTGIGAGYTNANNTGRYEYAIATNTIGAAGGNLTFTAVGGGNGLMYAYTNANASATMGQRRFQVVRVPQYTTATLGATLTAASWNGTTGGILAFDVAGDLALGGVTVNVNGLGFRGGAGLQRAGGAASENDYRNVVGSNAHGVKGEGIAGTPEWVLDGGVNTDVGPQGYPNGDFGRGAPGTAGGGGTDTDPALNQENSGGGGGANWGRGGNGGNAWQSNLARGGFGGAPFYDSPGRVVLGGGGGAGARNNSSGVAAAGAAGGGIVLVRAGRITGNGTITANGAAAFNDTANDGGGGGGAGGSIVILSRGGGIGGLTLQANGGRGGDAWRTQTSPTYPGERHGPGGGGGGGYIATNGTPSATSVTGGSSGITTTNNDPFGAQPGAPGNVLLTASFDEITGVKSGCTDLSVTISDSPDPVNAGNNVTYTIAVTNNSTTVPAQGAKINLSTATGTTFVSITPPAGWTCGTTPAAGGTGAIECTATNPLAVSTTTGNFTLVLATDPAATDGSSLSQQVATSTTSPEPNTANNTDTEGTTVRRRVDIAVTKATSTPPGTDGAWGQGDTLTYTITVTNNGPSRATNVVLSDPLPAGFSFTSVTPGGPTCTQSAGTVTCTYAAMNPGVTNNVSISGTITVNRTQLVNTATATRTEVDTDATNDSASATANVRAPTVVHLLAIEAVQDSKGKVLVSWTTTFEAENLGFNLYRETGAGRVKVNKQLIAGSALFAKKKQLDSGNSYRWKDKVRDGEFAQYYLEDVDLHGVKTMHGPVTPSLTSAVPETENTDTLADLGSTGGIFVSPRGIGAARRVATTPAKKQREQQYDLASQAAIKLMVTEEGWYHVTLAQLTAAGFAPGKKLALFTEGVEQPILMTNDAIEFYGTGLDTPSAGARAYWLVNDKGTGVRIKNEKSKNATPIARTPFTFERVERTVFFAALTNNGDRENFFGAVITNGGATQELTTENLDRTGSAASLELVLQGGSDGSHAVRLDLNGAPLSTVTFDGLQRKTATLSVPLAMLLDGTNTLTLTALHGDLDIAVVESLRLTYPHKLVADDDALKLTIAGGSSASIAGFTSARVRAIDVTDPAQPVEVGVELSNGNATLTAPGSGTRTILVIGESRVLAPAQLVASRPSTWNDTRQSADLLVIAARGLASAAEPLQAKRQSEGLTTIVVDVQDLYDEFGFGHRGPQAIREFLARTREWKRAPRYVLLLGDASIDPRNYLTLGTYDLVPTKLVATQFMKTASDDWFVDFANTGLPQLAIGRLPARTLAEAQTMIGRIVNRDTSGNDRVAFVTDTDPEFDFAAEAQSLATLVPPSQPKTFATAPTPASFESLVLTYIGHGSVGLWNAGSFHNGSAAALQNGAKRPIVVGMTCLNGYFHDVFTTSLAEDLLLAPHGGAVAVWTSSTLTFPDVQMPMAAGFFRHLFAGATLGEAAMRSKTATPDPDVRRSWILLGDPSMKLR